MVYKYSIIIPHYNDFEKLKGLLASIPNRSDIEIIIIDDNSTDPLCLSDFENRNVSFFVNDSGVQSAGACRNIGLKAAQGKWLLFADSDDFFTPTAFDVIDENADTKYDIVYFSPTSIDSKTGLISDRHINYQLLVKSFMLSRKNSINYFFYVPWSKLILNSFVKKHSITFDEVLAANDVMFSLKAGMNAKHIQATEKEIYCVTKREGSLTSSFNREALRSRYAVSLRRNHVLFQAGLKTHQESIYSLLKRYHKTINIADLWWLFKIFLMGQVILFPPTSKMYLTNPSALYTRLFRNR